MLIQSQDWSENIRENRNIQLKTLQSTYQTDCIEIEWETPESSIPRLVKLGPVHLALQSEFWADHKTNKDRKHN